MSELNFAVPDWYRAIALEERIASLKSDANKSADIEIDSSLARARIERWKSQTPFDKDSYFSQRLKTENISEEDFLRILGEPVTSSSDRFSTPPDWWVELMQAFFEGANLGALEFPEEFKEIEIIGFLELVKPLIVQSCDRLRQGLTKLSQNYSALPFNPDTIERILLQDLPRRILPLLSRTLVLELNVARLQGWLCGDTPAARFQSFIDRLRQLEPAFSILQEYPVLARQIAIRLSRWVAFSLEFLQHLCGDWELIQARFYRPHTRSIEHGEGLGVLTEVSFGAGDTHRQGRSVAIATFSSGFRIVYKPRSLALDLHFQELLEWINQKGEHPPFSCLKVSDRGTYGWMEFVEAQTCDSEAEVERFYQRQGAYLAILYALEAVDFHHENLIAVGEQPILLDLEALFHPRVGQTDLNRAGQLASNTLNYSVYGIGLLPHRIWSTEEAEGIDISGLGSAEGQLTPHQVPRWQGMATDEMKLTRERVEMSGTHNQPTLKGKKVNVLKYAGAIAEGFTYLYNLLSQHRQELLAENGPLASFAEDTIRVIVRPTRTYTTLLSDSFHPDMLRHALERDRLFDRLWVAVEHLAHLARLIPAERQDLWQGDIPIFVTRPDSQDIWTSSGQRLPDFLERPTLASVRHRVAGLNSADLERQLWIIRASLTSLALGTEENAARPSSYKLDRAPRSIERQRLETAARAVGDRLEALALRGDGDAAWIGLVSVNERHWSVAPLGTDLYDGLPGVILFLAYLGKISQEQRYTDLARSAWQTLQLHLEQSQSWLSPIGAFNGWGGIIYTLTHLGTLWDWQFVERAKNLTALLPPLIEKDRQFDLIGGAAGCIISLLRLYCCDPSADILKIAIQCGDRLLLQARSDDRTYGWIIPHIGSKPLTGCAHGNAGIAWALLELAAVSKLERFQKAALKAIDYERRLFCVDASNWPDLREFETAIRTSNQPSVKFMIAWCHGAPGIGLTRLQCLRYLDDPQIRLEIDTALNKTLTAGFGKNHSLCHGDLGNLELLLQASETLDPLQYRSEIERLSAIVLDSIDRDGWLCGIPLEVESPGLMTGLAGIGYGLLRLLEPSQVPSILGLAPPPGCGDANIGISPSTINAGTQSRGKP